MNTSGRRGLGLITSCGGHNQSDVFPVIKFAYAMRVHAAFFKSNGIWENKALAVSIGCFAGVSLSFTANKKAHIDGGQV